MLYNTDEPTRWLCGLTLAVDWFTSSLPPDNERFRGIEIAQISLKAGGRR